MSEDCEDDCEECGQCNQTKQKRKLTKAELEETYPVFVNGIPAPMFPRLYNIQRMLQVEVAFSEGAVESPEQRKERLRGYCV
jgi:hypothetical protein